MIPLSHTALSPTFLPGSTLYSARALRMARTRLWILRNDAIEPLSTARLPRQRGKPQ
jgi:hypothetical protein